ncbi:MAG: division/cell wall cluster transcriptional repressor MraZ [Ilumatobacteraceae bacterium]
MRDRVFSNRYERQLDDKGRLALPAKIRSSLGEQVYLARGRSRCVNIVPVAVFEAEATRMLERVERGELDINILRAVVSSATLVSVDKQGRVSVEEHLRDYAGLTPGSAVMVTGMVNRLEIWPRDRYTDADVQQSSTYGDDT